MKKIHNIIVVSGELVLKTKDICDEYIKYTTSKIITIYLMNN